MIGAQKGYTIIGNTFLHWLKITFYISCTTDVYVGDKKVWPFTLDFNRSSKVTIFYIRLTFKMDSYTTNLKTNMKLMSRLF